MFKIVSFSLFFPSLWLSLHSMKELNEQRHAYYVVLNVRIRAVKKHSNEMKNSVWPFLYFSNRRTQMFKGVAYKF